MAERKNKIIIDARMIDASGIGVYISSLINGLSAIFDITLLGDPGKLNHHTTNPNIIPAYSGIYSIKEQFELLKLIPECDLFWSPHYNIPALPVKAKKRVVTIHDVYHLAFFEDLSAKQKIYARLMINAAVRLSNEVITVSNFSKDEIVKYTGCASHKIQVIHNGVSKRTASSAAIVVNSSYNLPNKYILFVGNVKPHKNLITLLKAYQLLPDEIRLNYKIVIVGKRDGFLTGDEQLTHWINANNTLKDSIVFTGYVEDSDMNSIYANASLFVFPSKYEGFGLPPLEAMLNNCPVIAANNSSMPEVCSDAAIYFDTVDEADLSNKIKAVITDQQTKQQLINKGSERVKLFNWDDSLHKHIEIFTRIIDTK